MRILGIDPGSRITGFGIIDLSDRRARYVVSGCIRLGEADLAERLRILYEGVLEVIDTHRPAAMAVEQVFVAHNPRSALMLGHARGAAICAGVNRGLPVSEYSALEIKRAVVGKGNAAKQQVQHMVRVLLELPAAPQADAADALACAVCHGHTAQGAQARGRGLAHAGGGAA
jgi:crossover junction endodeoxyribonuclease RuvC